jgi:hypothetical protein
MLRTKRTISKQTNQSIKIPERKDQTASGASGETQIEKKKKTLPLAAHAPKSLLYPASEQRASG